MHKSLLFAHYLRLLGCHLTARLFLFCAQALHAALFALATSLSDDSDTDARALTQVQELYGDVEAQQLVMDALTLEYKKVAKGVNEYRQLDELARFK